jgi:hypothetical protein
MHENATCWVAATRVPVMSHLTAGNLLQYKFVHVHFAKKYPSTRIPFCTILIAAVYLDELDPEPS